MTRVIRNYIRPASLEAALAAKRADPGAAWLAGGTFLLAGDRRDRPESVIDVNRALSRAIVFRGADLEIGALATFQDLADSAGLPAALRDAASGMASRNTRNRATIGGNLGANKSCSSLVPVLLALDARVIVAASGGTAPLAKAEGLPAAELALDDWLDGREGLVLAVKVRIDEGRRAEYRRWSRTACDLALVSVAVSLVPSTRGVEGVRIAMGGFGPRARRFPELESLFEGSPGLEREAIERVAAPLLRPIDDARSSAAFKRLRGAALLAEALLAAAVPGGPASRKYPL